MVLLIAQRPRWIVFDAVGTLLYPEPPAAVVYHAWASQFGSRLTLSQVRRRLDEVLRRDALGRAAGSHRPVRSGRRGLSAWAECRLRVRGGPLWRPRTTQGRERLRWRKIVRQVLDDVSGAQGRRLFARLWHHFRRPEHWRLYPEVPGVLAALQRAGYHLAVASNFDRRLRDVVRGHAALAPLEALCLSSELGFSKPDLRFFRAAQRRLGATGKELLMVGDQVLCDQAGAAACGWQTWLVDRRGPDGGPGLASLVEWLPRRP